MKILNTTNNFIFLTDSRRSGIFKRTINTSLFFYNHEVICPKHIRSYSKKNNKWSTRVIYYKRAEFINKFSFLLPMKNIWNRLYKTHLTTKLINNTLGSSLATERTRIMNNDFTHTKSDFILFNKYWNHYTSLSTQQLPLWNFKTFNQEALLMRCSYDSYSKDSIIYDNSKNFFKDWSLPIFRNIRLIPILYFISIVICCLSFLSYFLTQYVYFSSSNLFDFYINTAFYFIWDLYVVPTKTYFNIMFQYPEYIFRQLLLFELQLNYKGPGYWEFYILDESELFLALTVKTFLFYYYVSLMEFWNTWIPEQNLSEFTYVTKTTYMVYEHFIYLFLIPFLTWQFTFWDIDRLLILSFMEFFTTLKTANIIHSQLGGIWNSAYTITLNYGLHTGDFKKALLYVKLKLVSLTSLTIDPQTWVARFFDHLENLMNIVLYYGYLDLMDDLNKMTTLYIAFHNIYTDLFVNFIYYRIQWFFYTYIHKYFIIKFYEDFIIDIIYKNYILKIYNFFYTYCYWYTTWYLFKALNFIWSICWFIFRKILFIDSFLDWWNYFSFRLDLPYIYSIYFICKEFFYWFMSFFIQLIEQKGYYFKKEWGDALFIYLLLFFQNSFLFGPWLNVGSFGIQLFSLSFPLYIHDSIFFSIYNWSQDLGSLNFYIIFKSCDSMLNSLFFPITFLFFDTKWYFPEHSLNLYWRPYNTDWYVPENFWFLKRYGPVFYEHVHIKAPYTLLFGSDFFFFSTAFLWNLDRIDKPIIDSHFWAFDFLEQEWVHIYKTFVMDVPSAQLTKVEFLKYAEQDILYKSNISMPFLSFIYICQEFFFTSVKITTGSAMSFFQLCWKTGWLFIFNLIYNLDDTYVIITYKNFWKNWFLIIFQKFYFSELRLLYLLQDGYIRIEKLKLFLKIYKTHEFKNLLVWVNDITASSVFLPGSEDIFFKSFLNIVQATRTINILENCKDYFFIRDIYGANLLLLLNDVWFTQSNELLSNDVYSSLTVIFWEAFNMWSLDDVDSIEKGDSMAYIDGLDIHNLFIWERFFYFYEFKEFLLTKYWHHFWVRPIYNHWWARCDVQSGRELVQAEHPYWTAVYDRHLWKGFVNYNYNLPYRKGFSIARTIGFKPGFSTGTSISQFLAIGRDSGLEKLGSHLLFDVDSKQQQMLMFRNLNNDPLYVAFQYLPKSFSLFLNLMAETSKEKPYIKRHDLFIQYTSNLSIVEKIYHFLFVDSLYSFFIYSGLPAGYIETLQLSNMLINGLNFIKFLEIYFFYLLYISLLINTLWDDFLPGDFETYFILYFIFFSEYSLLSNIFINENLAITLFMTFYKLKLFIINDFNFWSLSKWENWFISFKYASSSIWPKSFNEERFLFILKQANELELFVAYYKYIYNVTFYLLWFEFLLTTYFVVQEQGDTSISHHNYIGDFYTWKYDNISNLWIKDKKKKIVNAIESLNIGYMLPYMYDGYTKIITHFSKAINDIFIFIRSNFYFFNEDLILKEDYIKSMLFFNLVIEAVLNGHNFSEITYESLFKHYIINDNFFKELNIYFTYIFFYNTDNYILFFNPWTDYLLKNDFNIYEYVWNKRTIRWQGLPGFWYLFDLFYFIIFVSFFSIWCLILDSYLRSLVKKGDPWYDFIVSIYPELIQRHKKAYVFKDTFVVDEESADNLLEFYKYYYDSFDYIYLPYRSFQKSALPQFNIMKDPHFIDINPLTGQAVYLIDFTKLKKPFTNLFSYNSRFLLQKHVYEADRYLKRHQKTQKNVPTSSWFKYKDSFKKQIFKQIPWSIWLFFIVFLFFFSVEYFFFFKRSWLFNFFFFHKISIYLNTLWWDNLFFSIHPFFFDGLLSIFILINFFILWYLCWLFYLFFYLWINNYSLLTSNIFKQFYFTMIILLWNLVHSLRFWKTKIGLLNLKWFEKITNSPTENKLKIKSFFLDNKSNKIQGFNLFLKDLKLSKINKQNILTEVNQNILFNFYLKNLSIKDLDLLNYIEPSFLNNIQYNNFLNFSSQYKNWKNTHSQVSRFYIIDKLVFENIKPSVKTTQNLLKTNILFERMFRSQWTLHKYIKTTSFLAALPRNHNNLSSSFIENFFQKSKELSLFSKWDLAEVMEIFDDMPLVDKGAPREIMDPNVPNFLGDQMPELLDYVNHQWFREENLYSKDFTNLSQREVLERSARYTGVDNAWYFVDLHNKLDLSSKTGSFFRKQFYDDLLEQKKFRIETKKAWLESDINIGITPLRRKYNYTVDTSDNINNLNDDVKNDITGFSEFSQTFYTDYKSVTVFKSIQGDTFSTKFVEMDDPNKIRIENLDLIFDLDYDITNL